MNDNVFRFDLGDKVYVRYLDKEGVITSKVWDKKEGISYTVKIEEDCWNYNQLGEPAYVEYLGKKLTPVRVSEEGLELREKGFWKTK